MVLVESLLPDVIDVCQTIIFDETMHSLLVESLLKRWPLVIGRSLSEKKYSLATESAVVTDLQDIDTKSKSNVRFLMSPTNSLTDKQNISTARVLFLNGDSEETSASSSPLYGLSPAATVSHQTTLIQPFNPLYTIHNVFRFPSGLENGVFLGLYLDESLISISVVKCYGNYELTSRSSTISTPLDMQTENKLKSATEMLSKIIDEFMLANTRITLGLTHQMQNMSEKCHQILKNNLRKSPNLKNIFVTENTILPIISYLMLGIYKKPEIKFVLEIGETVTLGMLRTVPLENGTKRRTVITIDVETILTSENLHMYKGTYDDPYQHPKALITGTGLPEIFRRYVLEAIIKGGLLKGTVSAKMKQPASFRLEDILELERKDELDEYACCRRVFQKFGYEKMTDVDCIQIQFINRALFRRACVILAAIIVSTARRFSKESANFALAGSLLLYPKFSFYLTKYINLIKPHWIEISLTCLSKGDLSVGAGVSAALGAQQIIQREEALRSLPFFQIFECTASQS